MGIKHYDVFVIGTGTAGQTAAKKSAKAGKKVGVADKREYGGTCPNRGCDPKKVLIGISEIMNRAEDMEGKGISRKPEFSWPDLMKFKEDNFTGPIPFATERDFKELGIELYHQSPEFLGVQKLSVEGKTITADKIVIATGQEPVTLPVPGAEHAQLSADFLSMKNLPESIVFIGGGYVGMEFAHLAASLGVEVTLFDSHALPVKNFDPEMSAYLSEASESKGINLQLQTPVNRVEKLDKYYRVTGEQNGESVAVKAEAVFNTAGRVPSIERLNLEAGEVTYSKKGVEVNDFMQNPGNKHVFACGDVAASEGLPLTPLSTRESIFVAKNILDKTMQSIDYPAQPSCVFTQPQLASVGLSEEEAKSRYKAVAVKSGNLKGNFNAKRINAQTYAFKTLVNKRDGSILGAHLVGPEAAEVINTFALAMAGELSKDQLKKCVLTYPTWGSDIKSMV